MVATIQRDGPLSSTTTPRGEQGEPHREGMLTDEEFAPAERAALGRL
ncbi:hypothetical protein [Streptomyces sp. DT195]